MTTTAGTSGLWRSMPRADDLHVGLIHVFLVDEVDAGFGSGEFIVARRLGGDWRKAFESGAHFGFHGGGIEVAADADDELVP